MGLIRFAIDNPVKVAVGVLLIVLFGFLSIFQIPIQLTPNVDRPRVTVTTYWYGASPQEIEREIVEPQEEKLKSVSNVREMTSTSREGRGRVELEFFVGTDKHTALRDVSDKLRQVREYPEGADEPTVVAADAALDSPIAWLVLRVPGYDASILEDFAEDHLKPILERAEGVASVDIYGGREREVQVRVDPARLAARQLAFRDIEQALRRHNINISAGTVTQGKRDYTFRTVGQYETLDQVANTVIAYRSGGPVRVSDVGQVVSTYKKQTSFTRSMGQFVLALPVRRETGTNVIKVMDALKKQIEKANEELLGPKGMRLDQAYDETVYIVSAIRLVKSNIIFGGILATVVLLLFLRSVSATLVVGLAIPISVIGTFLAVTLLGRNLNVVMLAGMAFAVGMVLDTAIVTLENIYRHRQMGKDRVTAAVEGAREVWGAVFASTLTTMAVFLPVVFVQEEAGQLFRDIAIAISAAVGLSLLVATTLIPTVSARVLRGKRKTGGSQDASGRVSRGFAAFIHRILGSTLTRATVVVVLTLGSVFGSWWLVPPSTYLPSGNRNFVRGYMMVPPGYNIDELRRIAGTVEDYVRPFWEAELGSPEAQRLPEQMMPVGEARNGSDDQAADQEMVAVHPSPMSNFWFVAYSGNVFFGASSKDPNCVAPLQQVMEQAGAGIPGVNTFARQASIFGRVGGGNSIRLDVSGEDIGEVAQVAKRLMDDCSERFGFCRPTPQSFDVGRPEIQIRPDSTKAADLGLTVSDVGFILEACVDGALVGGFRQEGDEIDLSLVVTGNETGTTRDITDMPIYTPVGKVVPLSSAVTVQTVDAPQQINHLEEMPSVSLRISPPQTVPLEEAMGTVRDEIIAPLRAAGKIPDHIITHLGGNADKLVQTKNALLGTWTGWTWASIANLLSSRMFLSILVVYLLMSALFESFWYPLIIMFSVPLATVGGFAGLAITHAISLRDPVSPIQHFDVLTMLGFVILIGIVVNNAILLVHQSLNNMRDHGMDPRRAISESVRTRFRPIVMTTLTTVFGLLPLAVMPGAGSELYHGIGAVLLGGLLTATIFTLILVPCLFSLSISVKKALRLGASAKWATTPGTPEHTSPARSRQRF